LHIVPPAHSWSGSVFAAMLPQAPSLPLPFFAAVQAWHGPPQGLLQQTPSAQAPLTHWWLPVASSGSALQARLFAFFGAHAPPTLLVQ
jgi:hypothetical protein